MTFIFVYLQVDGLEEENKALKEVMEALRKQVRQCEKKRKDFCAKQTNLKHKIH